MLLLLSRMLAALCLLGSVSQLLSGAQGPVISVAPNAQSPTAGIQEAIDRLPIEGGVVNLTAGEYVLRRSIRVRSNVTLQGDDQRTILRKGKQAGSKLTRPATTDDRSVHVEDAAGLAAGDEIGIFDRSTVGWLHAHAVIKTIRGNELQLDRRVSRALDPAQGAAVINYFPAITGTKISNVLLKDLAVEADSAEHPGPSAVSARPKGTPPDLGFTFAAINLVEMTTGRIEHCRIKGWPADGISVQKGQGNRVIDCVVENCRGPGLHAGGRETDSQFLSNAARGNHGDGFFFCAWVTRATVANNKFVGNQMNGIGGLGDSEDVENIVEDNVCEANGRFGIQLWNGATNTVRSNTCLNNSQSEPGRYSGIGLAATWRSIVTGNRCFDNQAAKTQKHGIEENPNCRENKFAENDCQDNAQSGLALRGTR
jgi:parallel beta-helix repeat protein